VTDTAMKSLADSILPSSDQVGRIASEARAKRMVITHLSPLITPENLSEIRDDIYQDYQGEVLLGHDLMKIEV